MEPLSVQPPPARHLEDVSQVGEHMKKATLNQKVASPPRRGEDDRGFVSYGRGNARKARGR